jgi:hypothetical protein
MLRLKFTSKLIIWLAGVVLLIGLAACSPDAPAVDVPPTEPVIEATLPSVTEVPATPPTPDVPPTVLLVTGAEVEPFLIAQTQSLLADLADEASMRLVSLEGLSPEMLTPEVQVVVGVGQNLDLNTIAANAPNVSFLAIGDPAAVVADNLSVIGDLLNDARQQAFMAGYLSALISSDNKIAALIPEGNPSRDLLAESYVVGARFFCGLCQPIFPPYNAFPQWEALPSSLRDNEFRPTVNKYSNIGVDVVYVHGDLISPELLAYLDELDIKVVSDRAPDIQRSNWVGTITADPTPALEALWPDLFMAAPGKRMSSAIVLTDRETGLVSEGRYRLFETMVAEIQAGLVSVEITP